MTCSGKSTFAKQCGFPIISCDEIRKEIKNEKEVWKLFYKSLNKWDKNICIDNTNCKIEYINSILKNLNPNITWEVEIKRFDISLWKAHYRNVIRFLKTGKWIPLKVMNRMYKNYKNLWKKGKIYGLLVTPTIIIKT